MKTIPITLLIALALLLAACGKRDIPGCTDPAALNHDPEATIDDGSCAYLSGLYAGNWIAYDTTFSYNPQTGDTAVEALSYGFSIAAIGKDRVRITGWIDPDCGAVEAAVSRTLLVPESGTCDFSNFICTHSGGRLRYRVERDIADFRGTAIRQE
jgi:hypothetical protein